MCTNLAIERGPHIVPRVGVFLFALALVAAVPLGSLGPPTTADWGDVVDEMIRHVMHTYNNYVQLHVYIYIYIYIHTIHKNVYVIYIYIYT